MSAGIYGHPIPEAGGRPRPSAMATFFVIILTMALAAVIAILYFRAGPHAAAGMSPRVFYNGSALPRVFYNG